MQQRCSISDGIKIKSKYFSFYEISVQYVISKDFEREENVTQLSKVFLHGRSLVKKTRFSPQHFGIHEAWPGQILRHRKIIYIQIQLLNNCSPRSLLWPSIILISDLHLYFTAFWRGLRPGSAKRGTIHHCLWLIDWLIIQSFPISGTLSAPLDPCHSLCQVPPAPPRDSPSPSPPRILRQIPQTPFCPSDGSCTISAPVSPHPCPKAQQGKQQRGAHSIHQQHHEVLSCPLLAAPTPQQPQEPFFPGHSTDLVPCTPPDVFQSRSP